MQTTTVKNRRKTDNDSAGQLNGEKLNSQLKQFAAAPAKHVNIPVSKIKSDELIHFATQLSVMLDSGVVLSEALDAIAQQSEYGPFKFVIADIAETVKSGERFSTALTAFPQLFNPMFISLVKASEASGKTVEMLQVLSEYLDFESQTKKQVKGALTYPFIMALMAVAATGTLMFFVLPRFMGIYHAKGASLPKLTQILVSFSSILGDMNKMTLIVTTLVILGFALSWWKNTISGRRVIDLLKIRTPVIGTMFRDMVVTRSMRIMATMLNTGVGILDTLEIVKDSSGNYYYQLLWEQADVKVRNGFQLSEAIQLLQSGEMAEIAPYERNILKSLIAPGVVQMLKAGERSGRLGQVTDKVSVFYGKKLETSIKSVMAMIEPIMIIVLGSIIGTIAIALLLPVFKISSVIAQ